MITHVVDDDPVTLMDITSLRDDTEEDLGGSDLHQASIRVLNEDLLLLRARRREHWHISNQLKVLMGSVGGKVWQPSPDILVHPTMPPDPLVSLDVARFGVPPIVIEVASESTYEYDLGTKRRMYGQVGVREVLLFDPTSAFLGTPVRAWHRSGHRFAPWRAGPDGRWHSTVLDAWFVAEGALLRVLDADGFRFPTVLEFGEQLSARERQLRAQDEELREKDEELREKDRRIAQLEARLRAAAHDERET